jgi:arylsulfatase A-like enzyme
MRHGQWKLHEYFEDNRIELYNLDDDLGETKNVAEENPDVVREMHGRLKAWRSTLNAPVPTELNTAYRDGKPR